MIRLATVAASWRRAGLSALLMLTVAGSVQAAQMKIVNLDGDNEGLNDATPVEPVGDNDGDTLGAQRLNALRYAAKILGSRIASSVPIRIGARFDRNDCSRSSATLGEGAPAQFSADFDGAPRPHTFYPLALANAQAGKRIAPDRNDITATFNSRLDDGDRDCLRGTRWYYGLDGQVPDGRISFVSSAVHELVHGLGFVTLVAITDKPGAAMGEFPLSSSGDRYPDIYSRFIQDLSLPGQPYWPALSAEQRAASITDGPDVVWGEANTSSNAPRLLTDGLNQGRVELYAPSPVVAGSSISHWNTRLAPDQLMEPFAPGKKHGNDILHGIGMASCMLQGIGWQLINGVRCPDIDSDTIAGPAQRSQAETDSNSQTTTSGSDKPAQSNDGGSDGDASGGGGCTIAAGGPFDPLWPLLLVAAGAALRRRRTR